MIRYFIFVLALVFSISQQVNAQDGDFKRMEGGAPPFALVSGKLLDEKTKEPIEFAAISIFRMPKDSLVGGILTNEAGFFELDKLRPGKYKISIAFMGYKAISIDTLTLKRNEVRNMGTLLFQSNDKLLKEVTVEAQQDMVKNTIDKKVFDAEKLAIANGGSANDVLAQVPTVSVDIDGNISLRGSGNVTILIDGRPSGISGAGRAGALAGLPASAIESVEVITNPSAKYDPDGMSGIINIVLKKNKLQGANGNATIGAGTNNKYNGNIAYNFRKNKVNIFSNYSFRYNERYGKGETDRLSYIGDTATHLLQNTNSDNLNRSHSAKVGMDYSATKKATFGVNATINYSNSAQEETLHSQLLGANEMISSAYNRYGSNPDNGLSQDYNVNYRQKFANPKQLLSAESNYSLNNSKSVSRYNQENYYLDYAEISPFSNYQNNASTTNFSINSNMLDFESPLFKTGKIESGLKNINRIIDNDFFSESYNYNLSSFSPDDSLNNRFKYNESIYAAYTSYSQSIGKWSYKAGLRAEQAITKSFLYNTGNTILNSYFNVFPSAFINRKLNDKQEVQFNYGRRINRPGTRQLSPFTDYSNPLILRTGNPYLKPEYTHNLEFSYLYNFKKVNFSATVFYRKTNSLIMRYISVNDNNQTIVTFNNMGTSDNMGLETVSRIELFKWWNITANVNAFQTQIKGTSQDGEINSSNLSWNARVLNNIILKKGWSLQASGFYNYKNIIAQGTILPMSNVDFAVKKDVLKKRGMLTLSVTDVFNTLRFRINTGGPDFTQESYRKRETRIATITFNYSFGSGDFSQKRKTSKNDNDYKSDDGGGF